MTSSSKAIDRYVAAFTSLTPDNMDVLLATVDDEVFFSDPFNKVTGKPAYKAIFDHMYHTCIDPRFDVTDVAYSADKGEQIAYLRWRMTAKIKGWPHTNLDFEGMSEVHLGKDGLITAHIDHWDSASQLFAKLPVIGAMLRPIMKRFVVQMH